MASYLCYTFSRSLTFSNPVVNLLESINEASTFNLVVERKEHDARTLGESELSASTVCFLALRWWQVYSRVLECHHLH